jgi:hypothetical protein
VRRSWSPTWAPPSAGKAAALDADAVVAGRGGTAVADYRDVGDEEEATAMVTGTLERVGVGEVRFDDMDALTAAVSDDFSQCSMSQAG